MKRLLIAVLLSWTAVANAQISWTEASTNQMAQGTAGTPFAVTPRRLLYELQILGLSNNPSGGGLSNTYVLVHDGWSTNQSITEAVLNPTNNFAISGVTVSGTAGQKVLTASAGTFTRANRIRPGVHVIFDSPHQYRIVSTSADGSKAILFESLLATYSTNVLACYAIGLRLNDVNQTQVGSIDNDGSIGIIQNARIDTVLPVNSGAFVFYDIVFDVRTNNWEMKPNTLYGGSIGFQSGALTAPSEAFPFNVSSLAPYESLGVLQDGTVSHRIGTVTTNLVVRGPASVGDELILGNPSSAESNIKYANDNAFLSGTSNSFSFNNVNGDSVLNASYERTGPAFGLTMSQRYLFNNYSTATLLNGDAATAITTLYIPYLDSTTNLNSTVFIDARTNIINIYGVDALGVQHGAIAIQPNTGAITLNNNLNINGIGTYNTGGVAILGGKAGATNIAALATFLVIRFGDVGTTNYTPAVIGDTLQASVFIDTKTATSFTYRCASATAGNLNWSIILHTPFHP